MSPPAKTLSNGGPKGNETMTSYRIVPMNENHIGGFHAAIDVISREKKYFDILMAPPLENIRRNVLANIELGHPQFVALNAETVVGWCSILPFSNPSMSHRGGLWIGILPEHRGKGLGSELLKRTIDAAATFGMTRVELTVREGNAKAITLYKKHGFEIEGFHRNSLRLDGTYYNVWSMARLLSSANDPP